MNKGPLPKYLQICWSDESVLLLESQATFKLGSVMKSLRQNTSSKNVSQKWQKNYVFTISYVLNWSLIGKDPLSHVLNLNNWKALFVTISMYMEINSNWSQIKIMK